MSPECHIVDNDSLVTVATQSVWVPVRGLQFNHRLDSFLVQAPAKPVTIPHSLGCVCKENGREMSGRIALSLTDLQMGEVVVHACVLQRKTGELEEGCIVEGEHFLRRFECDIVCQPPVSCEDSRHLLLALELYKRLRDESVSTIVHSHHPALPILNCIPEKYFRL